VKSALKVLYFNTSLVTADELKESSTEKIIIVAQGQQGVGDFVISGW